MEPIQFIIIYAVLAVFVVLMTRVCLHSIMYRCPECGHRWSSRDGVSFVCTCRKVIIRPSGKCSSCGSFTVRDLDDYDIIATRCPECGIKKEGMVEI